MKISGKCRLKHLLQWSLVPLCDTMNQAFMKLLGKHIGDLDFGLEWIKLAVVSPYLWLSFFADGCSFVIWMIILKRASLSFATPISSIGYVSILLLSWLGFHEIISLPQIIGVVFIMSGIILIGVDESRQLPKVKA